nr:venom protein [Lampona murina]
MKIILLFTLLVVVVNCNETPAEKKDLPLTLVDNKDREQARRQCIGIGQPCNPNSEEKHCQCCGKYTFCSCDHPFLLNYCYCFPADEAWCKVKRRICRNYGPAVYNDPPGLCW